jgi:cell wall-associated NlpC family hydrolase
LKVVNYLVMFFVIFAFFGYGNGKAQAENSALVNKAVEYIGTPYKSGGTDPKTGFDSSGFVQHVFKQALNAEIPRTISAQWELGEKVARNALQAGDVIFFSKSGSTALTHVAIYMGNDKIIHTTFSKGVQVTFLEKSSYWSSTYAGAKRIKGEPPISMGNPLVAEAMNYLGTPYVFGSETPEAGFDCSGFVRYTFEKALGIYLPRSTDQQWQVGKNIALKDIQPGDVIFFSDTYRAGISHNGIYVGNGRFIHANRKYSVSIAYLSSEYWQSKFTGVKRFTGLAISKENPIVSEATKYIGEAAYKSGGTSPETGFDTSGFVQYVFKKAAGMNLPRYASSQWGVGVPVEKAALQPGDIVFFQSSYLNPAIYIGNGQVVQVTTSDGVRVINMNTNSYWAPKYYGAKRVQ